MSQKCPFEKLDLEIRSILRDAKHLSRNDKKVLDVTANLFKRGSYFFMNEIITNYVDKEIEKTEERQRKRIRMYVTIAMGSTTFLIALIEIFRVISRHGVVPG